jgi:hypothetical protein
MFERQALICGIHDARNAINVIHTCVDNRSRVRLPNT